MAGMVLSLTLPAVADIEIDFTTLANPGTMSFITSPTAGTYNTGTGTGTLPTVAQGATVTITFTLGGNPADMSQLANNIYVNTDATGNKPIGQYGYGPGTDLSQGIVAVTLPTASLCYCEIWWVQNAFTDANGDSLLDPVNDGAVGQYYQGGNGYRLAYKTAETALAYNQTQFYDQGTGAKTTTTTSVAINTQLLVNMNDSMDLASLTGNVVLHEGTSAGTVVDVTVSLFDGDSSGKTIRVKPTINLKYGTSYALILHTGATGIKTAAGQIIPDPPPPSQGGGGGPSP